MTRLKNVTLGSVSLRLFETSNPYVNGNSQDVVLNLKPGADVDESLWLVTDLTSDSYNAAIIDNYIQSNILTRLP